MNRQEFVDMVVANHKSGKWLSCTFDVDGVNVGIKAYGKWVQRMEARCLPYWSGESDIKTVKAFRADVEKGLAYLMDSN